jgi:hypothetical protein
VVSPEEIEKYLAPVSGFYQYRLLNQICATYEFYGMYGKVPEGVWATFNQFKKQHNKIIKKNQHGVHMIRPQRFSYEVVDEETGETEVKEGLTFKPFVVFDNSQTISINKVKSSPSSFLKSIEELQKKEEEEKEAKKLEKFQNLRNRELEIIRRRKNKMDNLAKVITPKYNIKKDYITAEEREEKRQMEEEALIKKEIKKRRMKLQPISSHELNKFSKEVQRNEQMFQEELDQKKEQMKLLWKERKNLLPEYKSKFFEYNKQNDEKMRDEYILKKERIRQDVKDRIKFGEDIIKNLQPKYNDKLKNEREKNILKLKGVNKQKDIKEVENKLKEKANKITKSQPKNFKLNNKFVLSEAEGGKRYIKKLVPLDKTPDYLTEERINKEKNPLTPMIKSYEKVNRWENMLNDDKSNIYNNIEKIKLEADILQNKADTKKQLLKNERGSGNLNLVDDLNNEISNLYIGSIQAKLQILKKIGNN